MVFKMQEIDCQFLKFAGAANVLSGQTLQIEKKLMVLADSCIIKASTIWYLLRNPNMLKHITHLIPT